MKTIKDYISNFSNNTDFLIIDDSDDFNLIIYFYGNRRELVKRCPDLLESVVVDKTLMFDCDAFVIT